LPDLRADRRLGAEDFLSGARETALFGHFQERDELIEIHVTLSPIISEYSSPELR
jgi:hypothetical protein